MPRPTDLASRVPFRLPRPSANVRLFCLPFAGGGAVNYRGWERSLPESIEVCPVELPGRGTRFREAPLAAMGALVDDLLAGLAPLFDRPVAFFGHSMGARIALELARRHGDDVVHLFASGAPAPHLDRPSVGRSWTRLSNAELVEQLRAWGGTPPAIIDNAELMELALPVLRSDLSLIETYEGTVEPPLACDLTAFAGIDDHEVPVRDVGAWANYTRASFSLVEVEGDHFFVNDARGRETIFRAIVRSLVP